MAMMLLVCYPFVGANTNKQTKTRKIYYKLLNELVGGDFKDRLGNKFAHS